VDDLTNPSLDRLDALLANPASWATIPADLLRHLIFYQCLSYGISPDDEVIPRLIALARAGVARLDPGVRRQTVVQVARAIERVHRERDIRDGAGCTNGLLPLLIEDPDPSVVSTAACELAILLPNEDGDPLSGPHYVRSLLDELTSDDARAGIVAGLLQLGDERVAPVVARGWEHVGESGRQTLALLIQSFRGLHTLTVEFLLSWLEHEARTPDTASFGVAAATMARAGLHAAEHGIVEVERAFPVIDAREGEPFRILRQWTLESFRPKVAARLLHLASGATAASMMAGVIRCWGLSEGPRDA
jgi:hypothetical protein